MTNVQIPSPIPLAGRGFVAKLRGNYQPGEYRKLVNASINEDGVIVNRNNILGLWGQNYTKLTSANSFYGTIGEYVMAGSATQHLAMKEDHSLVMWSPASLPVVGAGGYHVIVSAFEYNGRYYWITLQKNTTLGQHIYYAYHRAVGTDGLSDAGLIFANLEVSTLLTIPSADIPNENEGSPTSRVFIQKDRLWIATRKRLYFSKVTDPANFAIPDGGFIGVRDQYIRDSTFLGDTIYIVTRNETYLLTYSTDPNEDALLRKIADVGGHSLTVHGSSVYFVNPLGIYEIFNTSVSKINDLPLEYPYGLDEKSIKIMSFEHYLVVIARNFIAYGAGSFGYWFSDPYEMDFNADPRLNSYFQYNVFFLDTRTGATHVVDFKDRRDEANKANYGYINDAIVLPYVAKTGTNRLIFMTSAALGWSTYYSNLYYMDPRKNWDVYDEIRKINDTLERRKPNIQIEIDGFVPDGSEYAMKKFRSLQIMAKFPKDNFEVTPSFDNNDFDPLKTMSVENEMFPEARPHFPARLPLMQRGKSLNLQFKTTNPEAALAADGVWDQLEISDVQVLWTYTSRLTEKRYQTLETP